MQEQIKKKMIFGNLMLQSNRYYYIVYEFLKDILHTETTASLMFRHFLHKVSFDEAVTPQSMQTHWQKMFKISNRVK